MRTRSLPGVAPLAALLAVVGLFAACTPDLAVGNLDASLDGSDAHADVARCDGADARNCVRDPLTDPLNCGTPGNVCPAGPHGTASCVAGHCRLACAAGFIDCDGLPMNGCEVDSHNDPNNCGTCGMACRGGTNAVAACVMGQCGLDCNTGYADCDHNAVNGCEVNITLPVHCGSCTLSCTGSTPLCSTAGGSYSCTASCGGTTTQCGQTCVDVQDDPNNCGSCTHVCPSMPGAAAACVAGQCTVACNPGYGDCNNSTADGCETNLQTSANHCGTCDMACTAPARATAACSGGSCSFMCQTGTHACGATCQDNTSVTSCGSNCSPCSAPANATPTCDGSACGFTCNPGFADCDHNPSNGCEAALSSTGSCGACGVSCSGGTPVCSQSGSAFACTGGCGGTTPTMCGARCTSVQSDPNNCGACGTVCPSGPNSTATCSAGGCSLVCNPGFGNCDGVSSNGCETNLQTDTSHCGTCATSCPAPAGGGSVCSAGGCASSCAPGSHLCGGSCASDSSAASCGGSCSPCPTPAQSTATCNGSSCGFNCTGSYRDCNSYAGDGCETDTRSDPNNCGSCGNGCGAPANGSAACSGGGCTFSCNGGFHQCGGGCADNNSVASCGGNCSPCPSPPNASATCNGSSCGFSCFGGWADCDGDPNNGCESNLNDPAHCGSCGNPCPSGAPMCQGGGCVSGCGPGQSLCGGSCVDTSADASNCGGCGNVCPSGPNSGAYCSGGSCGLTCAGGFGNCNGSPYDGCEAYLGDPSSCGACGAACPGGISGTVSCTSGTCTIACDPGFGNCDGDLSNGCETDFSWDDPFNCGSCGRRCPSTYCCQGSRCVSQRICTL